jgi:hypothetical protein
MSTIQSLTYRTVDNTRWGGGNGADLTATQVDLNFWTLFTAIQKLQDDDVANVGIDFFAMVGNQLFIHLNDHSVQGPFTVPATVWNPRGTWQPDTQYAPLDVVSENGALYVINLAHTSGATFSPNANDGLGHNFYTLMLSEPQNELPTGGTVGQRLAKTTDSPFSTAWTSDKIRLSLFAAGQPDAGELLLQWIADSHFDFPQGLEGSTVYANISPADGPAAFPINQNGNSIGTITLRNTSPVASVAFPNTIHVEPEDLITIFAPSLQDSQLADISFTLVGLLTE